VILAVPADAGNYSTVLNGNISPNATAANELFRIAHDPAKNKCRAAVYNRCGK